MHSLGGPCLSSGSKIQLYQPIDAWAAPQLPGTPEKSEGVRKQCIAIMAALQQDRHVHSPHRYKQCLVAAAWLHALDVCSSSLHKLLTANFDLNAAHVSHM